MGLKNWVFGAFVFAAMPATAQPALLDANVASEAELSAIPQLSQPLIQAIIAKRPLASPIAFDQLLSSGLNEAQRKQVYGRVFVPLNLNTASIQDIMLIPGMNPRLAGEFREYRPYRAIGEFRHEIGKYIGKADVARLERYVFVPKK
jgi:DNA uptake protein ComE-like DNA-binding protein